MTNIPGFLSPRSDLTIRGVPLEKMEALMNAAVDILGGRVEFSETAIYENEQSVIEVPTARQCTKAYEHPKHRWFYEDKPVICQGLSFERTHRG